MKNAIIIFMCLCLIFCLNGCKSSVKDSYTPDKLSVLSDYTALDTETLLLQNLSEIIDTMPEFMQYCKNPVYLSETSRVILAAAGNLNNDGNNDLAVVVEFKEEKEDSPGYAEGEFGLGARHIYIILGNADGSYEITNRNESLILEHWMGGAFGDPLEGVSIENGILSIKHYGGSSSRWGYTMRFSYINGQLVLMDMTELSHDTFTENIEETICDFANHTVTRYSWGDCESNPLLLFSGELPDKIYFFDDVTFDEIVDYSNI